MPCMHMPEPAVSDSFAHGDAHFLQAFWDRCTNPVRVVHGVLGIWVCSNILFNYIMCVRTPPGSTPEIPTQA
jgi:hypothetical protein